MLTMTEEDKTRMEAIRYKEDLKQLGIEERLLDTETCVRLPIVIEATPVGIRAVGGTELTLTSCRLTSHIFPTTRPSSCSIK